MLTYKEFSSSVNEDALGMVANGVIADLRKDGLDTSVFFSAGGGKVVFGFEVQGVKYKTNIEIPLMQGNKMGSVPKAELIKRVNGVLQKASNGDTSGLTKV
jgi:hypothetical protein